MNGRAYYNEIDPYAAQWLRNLIAAGHIAPGDVDERSIVDVRPDDLAGYTQCHWFAGIGGWSLALRLAGWPDDRSVWTGSCPCQPFSAAGAGKAADDSRHLWPAWAPLIAKRRPSVVFGEQVEAAIGWGWLDAVFSDLESEGYACASTVLPACGIGAPHIRQRLWFVADTAGGNAGAERSQRSGQQRQQPEDGRVGELDNATGKGFQIGPSEAVHGRDPRRLVERDGDAGELADTASGRQREFGNASRPRSGGHDDSGVELGVVGNADRTRECRRSGEEGREAPAHEGKVEGHNGQRLRTFAIGASPNGVALGDPNRLGSQGRTIEGRTVSQGREVSERPIGLPSSVRNFWRDADWIACTDGKSRPVGPGSFPLGHGIPRRTSKLRAYGNAIVPQIAAEFIRAYLECEP